MAEEKQVEKLERFSQPVIQRGAGEDPWQSVPLMPDSSGDWVRYSDVLNTLTEQGGEAERLEAALRLIEEIHNHPAGSIGELLDQAGKARQVANGALTNG
jgi:hypothetical protein